MEHCEAVGRDEREIERTVGMGVAVIRDSRADAQRVRARLFAHNGDAQHWTDQPVGHRRTTSRDLRAVRAARATGTSSSGFPAPYDEESMTRFATEVRPLLEALIPH